MIKRILRKLSQLTRYYPNVEKFLLERKKPIIVSLTILFFSIFGVEIWNKISDIWFYLTYRANKNWVNAFIVACIMMLLYEIKTIIDNKSKNNKEKKVMLIERFFVLIPFLWVVFTFNLTNLDYSLHFLRVGLSRGDLLDLEYYIINPSIAFYKGMPVPYHYAIFLLTYSSARRRIFSYFVRYQIMQILLIQAISYCVDHLLIMFVKYFGESLAEEAFFIGFNAYAVLTALKLSIGEFL